MRWFRIQIWICDLYDIIFCNSNLIMRLWFYIYQMSRFGQNMTLSFYIIFWKIVLQNKLASASLNQDLLQKIRKLAVGDQKKRWPKLWKSRAWKTGFKALKRDRRLTFFVWCNSHLPSFTPTSPTPLDYKNEKNWQLESTQERVEAKNTN